MTLETSDTSESNNQKNRKNQAQKSTAKKLGISERQKLVHLLDMQGFSNGEISSKIGVSISTVEKDLKEMRKNIRDWFSELGTNERFLSFVDAVANIDSVIKELWILTRKENDQQERAKILEKIVDCSIRKAELFKTSDSFLTSYYFKQKDLSGMAIIREMMSS